jgi:CBS domain-containing protein
VASACLATATAAPVAGRVSIEKTTCTQEVASLDRMLQRHLHRNDDTQGVTMEQEIKTARQLLGAKPAGVVAVKPDDTVALALKVMADRDIGAVLVMSGESLAGIFSERDYARKVELRGKTAATTLVREIMTDKVIVASPDHTINQCMVLMKEKRIRHLPVVENGKVIGVLSNRDVLETLVKEEEHLIQELTQERLYFTETGGNY